MKTKYTDKWNVEFVRIEWGKDQLQEELFPCANEWIKRGATAKCRKGLKRD